MIDLHAVGAIFATGIAIASVAFLIAELRRYWRNY